MRKLYFVIFLNICLLGLGQSYAQAPNINYASPQKYIAGPEISPLAPVSTGGAVPAQYYAKASTFAGSRAYGHTDGPANVATFGNPLGITKDPSGNIFVADANNNIIRKITPLGEVSTFAGSGEAGAANGIGTAASFNYPTGLTSDDDGNIYVADYLNHMIRKITPDGTVTTLAGDGTIGSNTGIGAAAHFNLPYAVAYNRVTKFIIISDSFNNMIKQVDAAGVVKLVAGAIVFGNVNGKGADARFHTPFGITVDKTGNIFVADKLNACVRKISPTGDVTLFSEGSYFRPTSIAVDSLGFVYVSNDSSFITRADQTGNAALFSGSYTKDTLVNKIGVESLFSKNAGLAYDADGNLLVADARNLVVRKVTLTGYTKITLPVGLTISESGVIAGRPTTPAPAADYAITAYNTKGLSTANINIEIQNSPLPIPVITFPAITEKTYGNPDFTGGATSTNTKVPVIYTSSNTTVATIKNDTIHIVGVGSAIITANQATDGIYADAVPVTQTLNVVRTPLTITADNKSRINGTDNPPFTATFKGFVKGENASVLIKQPVLQTAAVKTSPTGNYSIVADSAVAANYSLTYVAGNLFVGPQSVITFPAIAQKTYGDPKFQLVSTSNNSKVPVIYSSDNVAVAGIRNDTLYINGAGTVTITASQTGDSTFSAAPSIAQTITIKKAELTITADNKAKITGADNPELTISYSGFVYDQNTSVLITKPVINTTAIKTSPGGSYPITVSGASALNYNITNIAGNLDIVPIPTITANGSTTFLTGGSVVLSASPAAGYKYQWAKDSFAITGAIAATYTATESGMYTVSIGLTTGLLASAPVKVSVNFVLPPDNFTISATNSTCKGANNGSISIIAKKALPYLLFITGDDFNKNYTFDKDLVTNNLKPGTYSVCIGIANQVYSQCFSVNVAEPKDLSVYSTINKDLNTLNLQLGGSDGTYNISLNDVNYTTTNSEITLPLISGANKLTVTTDRLCQGVIEKTITLNNSVPYPNPFQNILNVNIGSKTVKNINYNVYSITNGKLVQSGQSTNQSGLLGLDLSAMSGGIYFLKLNLDGKESAYKIIKQ